MASNLGSQTRTVFGNGSCRKVKCPHADVLVARDSIPFAHSALWASSSSMLLKKAGRSFSTAMNSIGNHLSGMWP